MKRFNWYFPDGATYSYIDTYRGNEGEYHAGVDKQFDSNREGNERLPELEERHGEATILIVSPA